MATTITSNKVIHAVLNEAAYASITPDANTLYFVTGTAGIKLYKGTQQVGGGFAVLTTTPSDVTNMSEGVLYLAPDNCMYYRDGSTLKQAMTLIKAAAISTEKTGANADIEMPSVAAMYSAISAEISAALSGVTHSNILPPVQNLTALKSITTMIDKDICFVEDLNTLFAYDAQSTATADDKNIVQPTSGTGRWIRISAQFVYNTTDFTWDANSGLSLVKSYATMKSEWEAYASSLFNSLGSSKMDKATNQASASSGQYLVYQGNGAAAWTTLPEDVQVIATSSGAAFTASDAGKIVYAKDTAVIYQVNASGGLDPKIAGTSGVSAMISSAVSSGVNSHDTDANAHSSLFAQKAFVSDICWNSVTSGA